MHNTRKKRACRPAELSPSYEANSKPHAHCTECDRPLSIGEEIVFGLFAGFAVIGFFVSFDFILTAVGIS